MSCFDFGTTVIGIASAADINSDMIGSGVTEFWQVAENSQSGISAAGLGSEYVVGR